MSVDNMNKTNIVKYGLSPKNIKRKCLSSEKFRLDFNFDCIKAVSRAHNTLDKHDKKLHSYKKKKLREDLRIGKSVLVLVERIKKKPARGNFYKSSVQNTSFLNKENLFVISNKNTIDNKTIFWLVGVENGEKFKRRFQREQIFAVENNFI